MTDWKKTTLGQVAQVFTGFPFKSNDYSEDPHDIKLLRGDNIAQGTLRWDDAKKWPKSEYEKYAQYQLKEDDVVLAMDRPWIGAGLKYSSVRKEDLPSLLVQRTARLRGSAELDIIYLKYIIASPWFSKYIQSINTGSLVPHISSKQIKEFPVNLPSVQQQKRLSSVLATIDNKIDINNRINAELEAMAKTLYDYWFIQFDFPDINGKPYKTSGGKMVYNATLKREIPAGWRALRLNELLHNGADSTGSGTFNSDVPYTPIDALPMKKMSFGDAHSSDKANTSLIKYKINDILIGAMRVYFHRVCIAPFNGITRTTTLVLRPNKEEFLPYIYQVCNEEKTINIAAKISVGTQQPYVNWENSLENLVIAYPENDSLIQRYSSAMGDLVKRVISGEKESSKLKQLHEWLLPLLMNGQVSVK
ncbi:restriction endonuclease subunit S [Serratia marcescens]|uniref:restriction endonuclease subunit S n=1 Tax=Serratia marcescens TaxID=615 RepID=UPI0007454147|nr:restriction endonuclease subunit S [Serratia marcescens]CVE50624.1 EcoKI restriction-modification system protein HsdS [Serratia marcescens]